MMNKLELAQNVPQLDKLGNIPSEYRHHKRLVTPADGLSLKNAYLKWYNIHRSELSITPELVQESRDFVQVSASNGQLELDHQLGFVLLHRCDEVAFLFVITWQNVNELWRTLYYKDLVKGGGYQLFEAGSHAPTYCVWELAAVWHEKEAWGQYLYSNRDETAKYAYLNNQFSGLV